MTRRLRLRDDAGFTLPELLVSLVIGMFVVIAAMTMLDATLSASTKLTKTVDAQQRGRVAMDRIVRDLRSQVCVPVTDAALLDHASLAGASATSLDFYVDLGDGSTSPQRRVLTFDPALRRITLTRYNAAGTAGAYTWPTASPSEALLQDVVQADDPASAGTQLPVFQLFAFDETKDPPTPTLSLGSGPLSSSDLDRVARIEITFRALRSGGGTPTATTPSVMVQDDVYRRAMNPNSDDLTPKCW